jgi:hypothetical protein
MSRREKLVRRFLSLPRDFTWKELVSMLAGFGYEIAASGATTGSRVKFLHLDLPPIILHRPHPTPLLKRYQMEQVLEHLKAEGLL